MTEKRKRCSLSVAKKRQIIKYVNENLVMKKIDIAKKFEILSSTLATILKFKERFSEESGLRASSKRFKLCEYTYVEKCILKWLKQCRDKNVVIGGPILQEKTQQFTVELGHREFRASNEWLHNFKKRNEIIFRKICGESAEVNEEVCDEWRNKLETQSEGYDPKDIFNIDETGLFYKCSSDKTLSFEGDKCHGGKNSKLWLTVFCLAQTVPGHTNSNHS
ncbi:tigger transposable element-derived protein 6-like [Cotesia glomerata]|uniref:tigger transposable element-derived protein 6-like n=1 Tax=Cotesia glomerata TaxID=32391 RepID=UPI001D00D09B|nr:tigger transposable element-derived protein 6-like [Cotesia glomerata]